MSREKRQRQLSILDSSSDSDLIDDSEVSIHVHTEYSISTPMECSIYLSQVAKNHPNKKLKSVENLLTVQYTCNVMVIRFRILHALIFSNPKGVL